MFRKAIQLLERGVEHTTNILYYIGMGMLATLMFLGTADVIGRYFFNSPIIQAGEIGKILMALMVFFAWGSVQRRNAHIKIDLLVTHFNPRTQAILDIGSLFVTLVLFGFIIWQAAKVAKEYWEANRLIYVIEIPLAPFQLLVSVGALVVCFVLIVQIVHLVSQVKRKS